MPKVSVVIPCYNHGEYLQDTLDSVYSQTFTDYEIVIVDDGSTDVATLELLSKINNTNIKIIHTKNKGVAAARNRAIYESRGKFILPLDADDMLSENYLECLVSAFEDNADLAIAYGIQEMFGSQRGLLDLPKYDRKLLLIRNMVHATALFRKSAWSRAGGYCEAMTWGWEDWDFWLSLFPENRQVLCVTVAKHHYRIRENSRDRSIAPWKKILLLIFIIMRHPEKYLLNLKYVVVGFLENMKSSVEL